MKEHDAMVNAIRPILAGNRTEVQGAVLADLLSMWARCSSRLHARGPPEDAHRLCAQAHRAQRETDLRRYGSSGQPAEGETAMKHRHRKHRAQTRRLVSADVHHCIGCGCDEINACDGGCSWVRIDHALGRGVCSECTEHVERWDAGRRRFSPRAGENVALSQWPMGGAR